MVGDCWAPVGDGPVRRAFTPNGKVLRCAGRVVAALGCVLRTSSKVNLKQWQDCFVY